MSNTLKSIAKASALLRNLEFRRLWALLAYWGLPKYLSLWRRCFGRYPAPINAAGIAQDPIMVYQMAKVGSKSVLFSLKLAYLKHRLPEVPIHHVHNLANLDEHEALIRRANESADELAIIQEYRKLRQAFDQNPSQHWNVISLIRDPVARQAGAFFHNLDQHIPDWRSRWAAGELPIQEVMDTFLSIPDYSQHWFDEDLRPVLGIDVYSTPFPADAGYQLYSNAARVDLLLIRLEDLNRVIGEAIERLLGINDFVLYPYNIGQEKDYAELYRAFKATPLPAAYVEQAYQTRLARHFYTEAERRAFTRKWTHAK